MTPPGSATAPLLMLLMITAQRVTSQERGRPSSPGGIPQDHAEAISLGGDPLETKGERGPDLWVRKASDEQPRPMRFTLYEPGSFQRPRVRGTNDRKGSDKGNTKKEVEKRIGDKAGGDRQKQSSGKSESSKTRTRKRKEKRAKSKKKQKKMKNKVNKKTLKKGKSKKASQNNNTAKHRGKKGYSQKRNKKQNNKEAREPKEEKGKNIKKKSLKKKTGKSNAKKPKDKIKVSNTKPKIRQVSAESCVSSTEVGVGEVVAVEGPGSRKAVDCKHTIRTRKGNTLKMTCPRFSLSPGRCKDERVVIKEIGKGKFKKKYCKGEIPGEDVSEAALRAVTFVHRRAKLKGKQCAVGFLCLFSASEISGKVSECGGKYQLQEGESMIVAPATFGDKISCKYTFKSPPGSTLALSCPSFNLNQRGCGRERVIVREKKAKYKKKFCKTSNPAKEHGQTTSNSLTLTHKRKKLKDNDCETGFWCQVSVVKGQSVTEQPTIGQSVTEQPTIGLPITDKPIVGQPVTDKPSIGQPVTDKPSQEPTTKPNPQTTPQPTSSQVHGIITTVSIPQGSTSTTEPPTSVQSTVSKGTSAQLSTPKQTLTQPAASTQTNSQPSVSTQTVQPSQTSKSPQPSTQSPTSTKTPTQTTTSTQASTQTTTSTQASTLTTTSTKASTQTTTSTQASTQTTTSTQASTLTTTSTKASTQTTTSTKASTQTTTSTQESTQTTTSTQTSTQPATSSQISPHSSTSTETSTQREASTNTTAIAFQTRFFCDTCGSVPSASGARVVGGQDVAVGEYPWMALVYVRRSSERVSICGASLIKSRWLLSAAHCFYNVGYDLVAVFLGDHDISNNTEVPTTVGSVKSIVLHPQYDPKTFDNDAALIELQADVAFTPLIAPVCLAAAEDVEDATKAVVTGWGDTSFGGDLSPVLQEVELDLISNAECRAFYQQTTLAITDNMMCAYTEGRDACQGDSGGPLVSQLADGRWVQLGVVSFGVECAKVGSPGIFTRASLYVDWIINVTASDSC
ncbi:uncharacterized protein LOC134770514 isoform X2 [Penaeus indicus]|uniref:uncharacterized protein LOC134770514 isoform X2 n=1 Tax=Penaeus indicus TaxID=29960 RepID=UPI00300D80B1